MFDWIVVSSQVITLGRRQYTVLARLKSSYYSGEEAVHCSCKGKISGLTSGVMLTFLLTYSLHNHLVSLLKLTEKIAKPHADPRKTFFFSLWLVIVIKNSAF